MKKIDYTNQFKRDAKKHFLALLTESWAEVMYCLINDLTVPIQYRDHALTGNLRDLRDCHIQPDLVLLYAKNDDTITLVRLGSHSELGL